ncbi:MAG: hypothetical protein ACSLEY_02690 [Candidatus Saccharimonadales bacterium]
MKKTKVVAKQPESVVSLMQGTDIIRVLVIGAVVGLIVAALYFVFNKYVFTPILCSQFAGQNRCENTIYFANGVAVFLSATVGLLALIRQRVYRPLLVVLLALISLWHLIPVGVALDGWVLATFAALLYALAYAAFAWIVQIRNFILSFLLSLILSVLVWWLLVS